MADLMLSTSFIGWLTTLCKCFITPSSLDQLEVTQELDSAMEQVMKLVEEVKGKQISSGGGGGAASSSSSTLASFSSVVVGVDEHLLQLKDRLTGMRSNLEIVPIVGMGGIGKTTLARKLFQDPLIVSRFVARAWTTISQDHNMRAILSDLLRCMIGNEFDEIHIKKENGELLDFLYRSLYGRRYLIVLDDMWSTRAWDDLRSNGSRIVITTRESDVHYRLYTEEPAVSGAALERVSERVASGSGGLPLAIKVIGGLLSKVRGVSGWVKPDPDP